VDYKQWVNLFGKTPDDPDVKKAVAAAGIVKPLKIGADELSVAADLPKGGMTIEFTDESIVRPGGLAGKPILTSVMMLLQHPSIKELYNGPLPHGIVKKTSKAGMRARFGEPVESDEDRRWDTWIVDGMRVSATYSRDLESIARLSVKAPTGN
jgi:hypothetical protein